jgi:hypothetical protein
MTRIFIISTIAARAQVGKKAPMAVSPHRMHGARIRDMVSPRMHGARIREVLSPRMHGARIREVVKMENARITVAVTTKRDTTRRRLRYSA